MKKPIHILIAEDSPTDAKLARRAIRKVLKNCEFEVVETRADFLRALETFRPDVILSDYSLPSFDGMKALKLARKHAPLTPLIIWSGSISEDIAVDCMKAGANNYVLKENLKRLGPAVLHALEERELLLARKQAEEALQNSEKRFRALIENGLDDISLLAADGSLLWESPSAIRNLGYIEGEFLGRNIFELMHPDDLEWTSNLFAKLVQEPGSRQTGIFRLHHFDATWHWVEAIATNMLNEPSVNAIVINYRDITERKQAEDTLRDREQGFRSITEDMTELICRFLPDGTLTYVNNVYCRYYGKSREELIGTNFITTAPVDLPQKHTDYFKSFSLEHPIDTFEQYDVLPNGEKRYREWVDRGIFDEWGHLIEIQSTGRDITARKQAEEALRESENRYRTLVETQTEFIVRWKSDSVRTFANKSYCDYFGLTPEEAISNSFIPLVYEQDRPNVEKKIQRLLSGEASVETEIHRVIRPDGKIGWQEWTDQAIHDKDGQLVEFQSVGRDITSRKQAEVERQVLLEIMQGLANADDLQEFLKLVHHSIAKVIYAENFFVVLYQPHSGLFEEIYSVDQFDPPAAPSKLEKSITSYIFRSGEPLLLTPTRFHELAAHGEVELIGTDSASWLGVPLKTSGRTIGVIAVQDYKNENRYSERDKDFLASIAAQVALAIERKRAEDALHKSEALYRQAIEVAGAVPYYESYYDDGKAIKYEFIGEGIRQITGYGPEEFSATLWDSLVEEIRLVEDLAGYSLEEGIQRVRKGENPIWTCEHRIRARDGIIHWVFEAAVELRDENGISYGSIGTYQDITTRKQAEEALRESEEHYRTIFEGVQDAIFVESTDGKILMVNERACEMFGYNRAEFLTKTVSDIVPEGHLILMADDMDAPLSSEPRETVNRRSNGEIFPIEVSGGIQVINGEKILLVVVRDITERKRAEAAEREQRVLAEALRDTAETLNGTLNYGEVLDHILAAVGRVVPHDAGTIMLIEGEWAQVVRSHGYDKHRYGPEIMAIKLPLAETTNLRQMLETRQPVVVYDTHSYTGWKRMPVTDWLRSSVGAPISIYGEVIGFVCLDSQTPNFFTPVHAERLEAFANQAALAIHNARLLQQAQQEIIEREQAEKELRASEERFRQLAENIQEVFWMTDGESGKEIYISPAAESIWGLSVGSLLHEPDAFINSVFPSDRSAVLHMIDREKNGEKVEIEYRIVRPDGSLRWIWDRGFPIFDESGKVKSIAGISADVTERRESELALIKSQSRYRELFDNSPVSIWEEDFSLLKKRLDTLQENGVTDLKEYLASHPEEVAELASLVRVTDANKAALELYGIEKKEVLLRGLTNILSKGVLSHFQQEILGLTSPFKKFIWEGTDQMLNGKQIEVLVTGSIPLGYEEDWSKVIVSVSDITERKHAEEEMRRRAEETSALLATSLALTSLDLKATLQTIGTSAKTLFTADGCRVFLMEPDGESLRCVLALQENFAAFSDLRIKLGEGVTGAVAASGRPEIVNEMQNDPRAVQVPGTQEKEAEAIMFAPLKQRDRTIGVLSIRRAGEGRSFQLADLELLEAFAAMAASAVSNARLFEETERRLAELEALYENGLAVSRLLKPSEIGNRIIETFANHLAWHHVTIRLRKENDDLELVTFNLPQLKEEERTEIERHFIARINKVGQGLSGWVTQTGEPLRTGDVHGYSQYIDTQAGIQSGLYMPLRVGQHVIGVISVESEVPDAFTEQDERLLATLANQAAVAFENARLYQAIERELSERKRAEEALRASETHYRQLADSITDILFEMDQDLHYTYWNKASEIFSGIPAEDAIGKSIREVFGTSAEQLKREEIYNRVLKEQRARTFEIDILWKGQKRALEINAYPSARGVSVVAKDVTDRKRSEIIMQKRFELMEYSAHHTLHQLMQKTTDEVSELTGSTVGFFHFVEADQNTLGMQAWSTSALQLFNVPVSEGTHLPLDQAGAWAEAIRLRRPLIQNDYESLSEKKSLPPGHVPIVREIVIPIIRNERIMAVLGIGNKPEEYTQEDLEIAARLADYAWDITERKQMEVTLAEERNQLAQRVEERTADLSRANSNLARALRVKDEFLANMSHELRTPLNAILGLSESLGEQIAGPLNEKQQKYIATIGESGHHLLALINDILDLAKIEAGQITLDINKVDIYSVCQASLRMIKQLAQKKNQDVRLEIEEGLGLMWADERRLKQMIVNLLGNAVKFTPDNGKIGLEVHGDQDANKITITVWDHGIGIKEADLARLFQPFVQLDSGLAREATGTGLGLALVAQMARLHGGSVSAISEPDKGSRFSIVLPWEPALAMDAATRMRVTGKFRAIKPDEMSKPTILLVEDTKEVVMMLQDYLELAGYKIVTAQDGVDGIIQAKIAHPDLILMDVQMPRMDGLEAARKLRSEPEFRYTPIIALTALAMPSDREKCLAAGMDEYISKPVNLKALVRIIQSCLFSENTKEALPR